MKRGSSQEQEKSGNKRIRLDGARPGSPIPGPSGVSSNPQPAMPMQLGGYQAPPHPPHPPFQYQAPSFMQMAGYHHHQLATPYAVYPNHQYQVQARAFDPSPSWVTPPQPWGCYQTPLPYSSFQYLQPRLPHTLQGHAHHQMQQYLQPRLPHALSQPHQQMLQYHQTCLPHTMGLHRQQTPRSFTPFQRAPVPLAPLQSYHQQQDPTPSQPMQRVPTSNTLPIRHQQVPAAIIPPPVHDHQPPASNDIFRPWLQNSPQVGRGEVEVEAPVHHPEQVVAEPAAAHPTATGECCFLVHVVITNLDYL